MTTKKPYATRAASIEIRQRILETVTEFRKRAPFFQSPTMGEIATALGLSKTSVYHHLCYMEQEGTILRSHTARGIVPAMSEKLLNEYKTTIQIDDVSDDDVTHGVMIDSEVMEILPLDSKEGVLITMVDGNKSAQIRVKRN